MMQLKKKQRDAGSKFLNVFQLGQKLSKQMNRTENAL
jgi:hypothetical protein